MNDVSPEEFLLFAVLVANKPAVPTRAKLKRLLEIGATSLDRLIDQGRPPMGYVGADPIAKIRALIMEQRLMSALRRVRTGQYWRIRAVLRDIVILDENLADDWLSTLPVDDLEKVVGPKTARFFILHTRPGARCAALDTHILKFLRTQEVPNVPRSTPPRGGTYKRLEAAFLAIADRLGVLPAVLDLEIWNRYSYQRFEGDKVYVS